MFDIDKVVRLYPQDTSANGAFLEIAPNPDSPESGIVLQTTCEKSEDWFGKINLCLSPSDCKTLGKSLIDYSEQFEEDNA